MSDILLAVKDCLMIVGLGGLLGFGMTVGALFACKARGVTFTFRVRSENGGGER